MSDNQIQGVSAPQESPISQELPQESQELGNTTEGEQVTEALKQPLSKDEKKYLKSLKLKVDGRELEEALPFEIPDTEEARNYMTRQLQMSKMSSKRAQEYAELEKDVRSFIELVRKDPIAALSDPSIGVDVKAFAAKVIEKEIEDSKKSPDQLKSEEYERKYKELEEKQKKSQKDHEEKEFSRIQEIEFQKVENQMIKAFEKNDIPNDPYYVRRIADYMMMGLQNGMPVEADDVLPIIREEFEQDVQRMIKGLDDDKLEKMIGKDVFNRIRKKNVSKAKAQITNPKPSQQSRPAESDKKPAEKLNYKKFFGL